MENLQFFLHILCQKIGSKLDLNWIFCWPKTLYGILSKMTRREFSIFIIFSDTYTCSYVMFQV